MTGAAHSAPATVAKLDRWVADVMSYRIPATCLFILAFALAGLSQGPMPTDKIGWILAALRSENFALALRLSQTALAEHPDDYRLWTVHGMAAAGLGNAPPALSDYEHALGLAPGYLPALEGAAQTSLQLHHPAARMFVSEILAQRPEDPSAHTLLGIIEYREGHCALAADAFARAVPVMNSQPEALTDNGTCLAALKRNNEAVTAFTQALALDPTREETRYNLALAQWDAHHPDEALQTLQPLVQRQPADPDVLTLEAEILESENNTSRAVPVLHQALLEDPKDLQAYLEFGTLAYNHASPQIGIDIVNYGLQQMPEEPRLYLLRGVLLTQLGHFRRAAGDFETANRLDPNLQFLGVAEGLVESQRHNPAKALEKFRAAVREHPQEGYAWYLLAEELKQRSPRPGSPEVTEELTAAKTAVKLDPELGPAHDLLSTLYYQNGQKRLAIEQSRIALARDPNDEQAVYHLILALRWSGDREEIAGLVRRLATLQADRQSRAAAGKQYRLYESVEPSTEKQDGLAR